MLPTDARPTETHTLHFDLAHVDGSYDFAMHISLQSYPLQKHDEASRARARTALPFLRFVPDAHLTHYIEEIALPSDVIALIHVTRPMQVGPEVADHLVHMGIHVPAAGHAAAAAQARARSVQLWDVHPKLARFGITADDATIDPQFPDGINDWQDAVDAATALLFHHPSLVNLNTDQGGAIPSTILNWITSALTSTGDLPAAILSAGDSWNVTVPALGPDGQPLHDAHGNPVYTYSVDPDVQDNVPGALALAIRSTKDDPTLEGQQWTLQYGVTTAPYEGQATVQTSARAHADTSPASAELRALDGSAKWALANLTPGSGLSIDSSLSYTPPPASGTFAATGIWADHDTTDPLNAATLTALLAGKVYLKIGTPDHPEGILRGQLVPTVTPVGGQPVNFTATLSGAGLVPPATTTASGTATFNLNAIQSGLTYNVTATGLGLEASATFGIGASTDSGTDTREFAITDQSGYGTLTVNATNHWLRHLAACVQFQYNDGTVITPHSWSDHVPDGLRATFEPDATVRYLAVVAPVITVFGVPIPPNATTISIPVPANAQVIKLYFGGLGRGNYSKAVCPIGVALTVVCEMALPIILLTAGAAVLNSKPVVAMMEDSQTLMAVCTVMGFLVAGGVATDIGTSGEPREAIQEVAERLGPLLLSPVLALGRWMITQISESAAEKAIPFFNIASTIINAAVTAAQLSETIVEVLDSPFVYEAEITRTIDLTVTVTPDHNYHRFPDQSTTMLVRVSYDKGATLPDKTFTLPGAPPWSDPIAITFLGIPAGGNLKVYVFFYAADGWQAGQGESLWFPAQGTSGATLALGVEVTTNIVPLSASSVYVHVSKVAYDLAQGGHYWEPTTTAPTATLTSVSPYPANSVNKLLGITLAQRPAQMAYAYEASGLNLPADDPSTSPVNTSLYMIQNLSTLQHPDSEYAIPPVGFSMPSGVFYDLTCPQDGTGKNFYIDPTGGTYDPVSNPGGGMHVRRVALTFGGTAPTLAIGTGKSWGRFPVPVDRYVMHSQGYVFGISFDAHKLYILKLATVETADASAPFATLASGFGTRDGLMNGPQAIAAGLDGRVLVLEAVNNRIQAFDISGKPVAYFGAEGSKTSTMALTGTGSPQYLDLAVESKGYIYILKYTVGSDPTTYAVDIYKPDGALLVTTTGVAAANIAVDILRNLFALNYEVILGTSGRTEPSVSLWIPPAPPK